jgi:hypothetical protein
MAIRIDVHPAGENLINMPHAFHARSHIVPDYTYHVVPVGNLLVVPTRSKQGPTPRRSLGDQRKTGLAVVLGHLIRPPSRHPWSRGKRFRPGGYIATLAYWDHKHQHVISTFNTYSRGPTHQSLTDTSGGYNLGGVSLLHRTSRLSQPMVSTFHVRALSGLQLTMPT